MNFKSAFCGVQNFARGYALKWICGVQNLSRDLEHHDDNAQYNKRVCVKGRVSRKSAVTPCKIPCKFLATIFKNGEWNYTRQWTVSQNLKYLQKETFEHGKHLDYRPLDGWQWR